MGLTQAVVNAEGPDFEISEDAMDPAQDHPGPGKAVADRKARSVAARKSAVGVDHGPAEILQHQPG